MSDEDDQAQQTFEGTKRVAVLCMNASSKEKVIPNYDVVLRLVTAMSVDYVDMKLLGDTIFIQCATPDVAKEIANRTHTPDSPDGRMDMYIFKFARSDIYKRKWDERILEEETRVRKEKRRRRDEVDYSDEDSRRGRGNRR